MISVDVTDAESFINAMAGCNDTTNWAEYTVNIMADIDMTGKDYVSPRIDGYNGAGHLIIEGNYHTITGLSKELIKSLWAGSCGVSILNLTLKNSNVVIENGDSSGRMGAAAFIADFQAATLVEFINCHVVDSNIINNNLKDSHDYAGAFYSYAAGYSNNNDGPVFTTINFSHCTVSNTKISAYGSAGGISGHAAGSSATSISVDGFKITNSKISSSEAGKSKAGQLFGTVGAAQPVEIKGELKNGGIQVEDVSASGNTVTNSSGDVSDTLVGRIGSSGGTMYVENKILPNEDVSAPISFADAGFIESENGEYYSNKLIIPKTYTISFDITSINPITATAGVPVELPALPEMEGYNAVGWMYNGTLVGYVFTVTDTDVTLTAHYVPAEDSSGGAPIVVPGPSQTVQNDEPASLGTDDIVVIAMCVIALLVLGFLFFIIKTS